ncbi:MAG TPA: multicopper oxidase domain-containing protein [Chloroflexota bacterium]|nr:multicopper oxidase domain-containing protein [Chloroflexota bacterium]
MNEPIRRRRLLEHALAGAAAGLLVGCAGLPGPRPGAGTTGGTGDGTARIPRFAVRLAIPPVLEPVRRDDSTDYYEVAQREARVEILPGLPTTIWGYEGVSPGPTIRARSGRRAVVRHTNHLPVPTVVHLHGGRTPSGSDGFPSDLVPPGGTREYIYPNAQTAATLWYHDHTMDTTGRNVYMGLAGLYLLGDDAVALQRAMDGFQFWGNIRGLFQVLAFVGNVWSLVAVLEPVAGHS